MFVYLVGIADSHGMDVKHVFKDPMRAHSGFFYIRQQMIKSAEEACSVSDSKGQLRLAQIYRNEVMLLNLCTTDQAANNLSRYPFIKKMVVE